MKKKRGKVFWIFWGIILLIVLWTVFKIITKPTYIEPENIPSRIIGNGSLNVVEFGDLQCPACAQVHPLVKELIEKYKEEVKYEFKHFPIRQAHPFAQDAGEAAECARDQGKFYEFIDDTYQNQNEGKGLRKAELKKRAVKLGLNSTSFNACLDSNAKEYQVNEDFVEGDRLNIPGTPTFLVNGKIVNFNALEKSIKEASSTTKATE